MNIVYENDIEVPYHENPYFQHNLQIDFGYFQWGGLLKLYCGIILNGFSDEKVSIQNFPLPFLCLFRCQEFHLSSLFYSNVFVKFLSHLQLSCIFSLKFLNHSSSILIYVLDPGLLIAALLYNDSEDSTRPPQYLAALPPSPLHVLDKLITLPLCISALSIY